MISAVLEADFFNSDVKK